jgi:hypothetical protein
MNHSKSKHTPTVVRVGCLKDGMAVLTASVVRTLCDGPRTIWADDCGDVFSGQPEASSTKPTSWIAGTYNFGQPMEQIAEDLCELARGHGTKWMLVD